MTGILVALLIIVTAALCFILGFIFGGVYMDTYNKKFGGKQ